MELFLQNLKSLGLGDREIKVYTTLIVFGTLSVTKLGGRPKLPRTTVDAIVRRLEERGFVKRVRVKGRYEWEAEDLTKIQSKANEAFNFIHEQLEPGNKAVQVSQDGPEVEMSVFHGKQQIEEALPKILENQSKVVIAQGKTFGNYHGGSLYDRAREMSAAEYAFKKGTMVDLIVADERLERTQGFGLNYLLERIDRLHMLGVVQNEFLADEIEICLAGDVVLLSNPSDYSFTIVRGVVATYIAYFESLKFEMRTMNRGMLEEELKNNI